MQAKILTEADTFYVQTDRYRQEVRLAMKSMSGRWNRPLQSWVYPASPAAAFRLYQAFCNLGLQVAGDSTFQLMLGQFQETLKERRNDNPDPIPGEKVAAFLHQRQSFWLLSRTFGDGGEGQPKGGGFFLAHDMGTGKSKIVVDYVRVFGLKRVLIVAPMSVVTEWPIQFECHGDGTVHCLALPGGNRSVVQRKKLAEEALRTHQQTAVVVNYEAVWREPFGDFVLATSWDMVVADEIHRIKEGRSTVSKFFGEVRDRAKRRVGMTGTPMPNSPIDLWAQMRFVDPGIFGDSFVSFRYRYGVMGGYQNKQIVAFRNLDDLHQEFYRLAHRVTKDEALDLPETVDEERVLTLSSEATAIYHEIETSFVAKVRSGEITVKNAMVELIRLQQLTGGIVTLDATESRPQRIEEVDQTKANALSDVFGDLRAEEPVVVFCKYHHDLNVVHRVAAKCGRGSAELSGRRKELDRWRAAGAECTVLAVQVQAGGLGVDLTRANYAVYYSLGFQLGEYEQSRARLHRQGQTRSVTYIHLLTKRANKQTIDHRVYRALRQKADVVRSILEDIKKGS